MHMNVYLWCDFGITDAQRKRINITIRGHCINGGCYFILYTWFYSQAIYLIESRVRKPFLKGPVSKYFRFSGLRVSAFANQLPPQLESSPRSHANYGCDHVPTKLQKLEAG